MSAPRFIAPDVLSRISTLELRARAVVEGFMAGLHKSPYKGFSVEFLSYRPYMPGDDLMHVDWKLYARTDRYYVKEFEEETNTALALLLDVSASMNYSSGGLTKREYASYLAASLAYLAVRQRDAAGITFFDDKVIEYVPPRSTSGHLQTILQLMESVGPGARSDLGKPLHELAERHNRRGFVALISDLLDEPAAVIDGLRHFRYLGHEVMVFHILDPQELQFEFSDLVEFEDMETGERILISPEAARDAYVERMNAFLQQIRQECGMLGIDYVLIPTDQPLDFALFEYLSSRAKRM